VKYRVTVGGYPESDVQGFETMQEAVDVFEDLWLSYVEDEHLSICFNQKSHALEITGPAEDWRTVTLSIPCADMVTL